MPCRWMQQNVSVDTNLHCKHIDSFIRFAPSVFPLFLCSHFCSHFICSAMWFSLGRFILKFRIPLLLLLLIVTAFMGFYASKVQMSYEFSKAIPTDNPKYIQYQQ